jgi:hypothetical protein
VSQQGQMPRPSAPCAGVPRLEVPIEPTRGVQMHGSTVFNHAPTGDPRVAWRSLSSVERDACYASSAVSMSHARRASPP